MNTISNTIERKFTESIDISEWEILTDTGWEDISSIHETIPYTVYRLETESGLILECADDHIVFTENYEEIFVKDLIPNESKIITKNEVDLVVSVNNLQYEENMYDITVESENHRFYSNDILSHNTTTSVGYILWSTIFQEHYAIAITANKKKLADEILNRYQLAYENLPMWLQQGVLVWNKGSVELENGSKVITSATSSSSVRGGSFNMVYMDELSFVPSNLAEEFFTSTYPVISSGKNTKLIITSTPKGLNMFYKMWMDAVSGINGYAYVDVHWTEVPGRDEEWKEKTIAAQGGARRFAQEYECQFLGSSNTLVEGSKLQQLRAKDYIDEVHGMEVFEHPIKEIYDEETQKLKDKDHIYFICADVSEGKNMDYSAFSVFDASSIPYKQVATYRNNTISPLLFPDVIKMCAEYYNKAYVLIEINNNPQVADCLFQDLEYENVLQVSSAHKQKQQISDSSKATQNGLNMSPLVKRTGCSTLKTLIETNKLEVYSADTIYELSTFVVNKGSFAAEDGSNDDLVMTLVQFAWLTTQKYFIEISSSDIRKRLQIENNYAKSDDDLSEAPPMPLFENPYMDKFTLEDGDLWETVSDDSSSYYF